MISFRWWETSSRECSSTRWCSFCAGSKNHINIKTVPLTLLLIRMFTNFGRGIVSSADLWYNEANEKPPSEREVARRSRDGRSLRDFRVVVSSLLRTLPQSASLTAPSQREPLGAHTLGVWAKPRAFVLQRRNWR